MYFSVYIWQFKHLNHLGVSSLFCCCLPRFLALVLPIHNASFPYQLVRFVSEAYFGLHLVSPQKTSSRSSHSCFYEEPAGPSKAGTIFVFMQRVEPQTYMRTACDYKFSGESLSSRVTLVSYLGLRWMQPFPCPSFMEGGFHSWPILLAPLWSCEGST